MGYVKKECSSCYGSGYGGSCYICNGDGRTKSSDGTYITSCSSCGGTGKRKCTRCNGSGQEDVYESDTSSSSSYSSPSSSRSPSSTGGGRANYQMAKSYFEDGERLFEKSDYDGAIAAFSNALNYQEGSTTGATYNMRAQAYQKKGEYDKALDDSHRALSFNENDNTRLASRYINRGWTYYLKGDYEGAIKDASSAIKQRSNYRDQAYRLLGLCYNKKGDEKQAIENYKTAVDFGDATALENLRSKGVEYVPVPSGLYKTMEEKTKSLTEEGDNFFKEGKYNEAVESYNKAIKIWPTAYLVKDRGDAYMYTSDYEKSTADHTSAAFAFSKALDRENNDPHYCVMRGSCYHSIGLAHSMKDDDSKANEFYTKAIDDYTTAINQEYRFDLIYDKRGVSYESREDKELAIKDYKLSADYGNQSSLERLNKMGITYKPKKRKLPEKNDASSSSSKKSSYADQRNGFVSFIFGAIIGTGILATVYWAYLKFGLDNVYFLSLGSIGILLAGIITTYIAWRNRKYILFFVMLALAAPGIYFASSEIIKLYNGEQTDQTQPQSADFSGATINANANFRSGPSTDNQVIRQLQQGDSVLLTGEVSGSWTQVSHNGDTGWVSSEFLSGGE